MPEWMKKLLEKAEAEGRVHVIHVNAEEPQGEPEPKDELAEAKEEAKQIAETLANKGTMIIIKEIFIR